MAYDISTKAGDTWMGINFVILLNNSSVDLTDASILMQVKKNPSDEDSLLEFSTTLGNLVVTDATGGLVAVPEVIVNLSPRAYVYDLQITLNTGRVITPFSGTFAVTPDISR